MGRKNWLIIGAVVLVVAGYLFLPVWQAWQKYETATNADQKCAAADELALAWGSIGFSQKREEWTYGGAMKCLTARRVEKMSS